MGPGTGHADYGFGTQWVSETAADYCLATIIYSSLSLSSEKTLISTILKAAFRSSGGAYCSMATPLLPVDQFCIDMDKSLFLGEVGCHHYDRRHHHAYFRC